MFSATTRFLLTPDLPLPSALEKINISVVKDTYLLRMECPPLKAPVLVIGLYIFNRPGVAGAVL